MSIVPTPHDSSAYEALDRLLFREWDPLNVNAFNGPDDEYRDYLPEFWRLVSSGASARSIAEYLGQIERDLMGGADLRIESARYRWQGRIVAGSLEFANSKIALVRNIPAVSDPP